MRYVLRIPGDGRFLQKEFDIIPSKGVLLPNCSQKVQVDFISAQSNTTKAYDLALVVDLDGVGQELGKKNSQNFLEKSEKNGISNLKKGVF